MSNIFTPDEFAQDLAARKARVDWMMGWRIEQETASSRTGSVVGSAPGTRGAGVSKSAVPDVVKVGPHGYVHGWIFVGVPGQGHVLGDTHHPLTGAHGRVEGPVGSKWAALDKDGNAAKSRAEAVAAVNTHNGNIHSLLPGDNLKAIGSVAEHETKPGFVSHPMSLMRAQGSRLHTTHQQAAKRVVSEWQKTLSPRTDAVSHDEPHTVRTSSGMMSDLMADHKLSTAEAGDAISRARQHGNANITTSGGKKISLKPAGDDSFALGEGHDGDHVDVDASREARRAKKAAQAAATPKRTWRDNPKAHDQVNSDAVRSLSPTGKDAYMAARDSGLGHKAALARGMHALGSRDPSPYSNAALEARSRQVQAEHAAELRDFTARDDAARAAGRLGADIPSTHARMPRVSTPVSSEWREAGSPSGMLRSGNEITNSPSGKEEYLHVNGVKVARMMQAPDGTYGTFMGHDTSGETHGSRADALAYVANELNAINAGNSVASPVTRQYPSSNGHRVSTYTHATADPVHGRISVLRDGSNYLTTTDPEEAHAAAQLLASTPTGPGTPDFDTPKKLRAAIQAARG